MSITDLNKALGTNSTIIETAEAHGVRSYIFIPPIVYGEGEGFGNSISIQTVAIVKAAKTLRRVYSPDAGNPVCVLEKSFAAVRFLTWPLEMARLSRC